VARLMREKRLVALTCRRGHPKIPATMIWSSGSALSALISWARWWRSLSGLQVVGPLVSVAALPRRDWGKRRFVPHSRQSWLRIWCWWGNREVRRSGSHHCTGGHAWRTSGWSIRRAARACHRTSLRWSPRNSRPRR
jgi:hypothetical protein